MGFMKMRVTANSDADTGKTFSVSIRSQRGTVIVYLVAVMLVAGILGAGIVSMAVTSVFTGLSYNPSDQARFLAKSGMDYAIARPALLSLPQEDYPLVFKLDNGTVELHVETVGSLYRITSTGKVLKETSREAGFVFVKTVPVGMQEVDLDFYDENNNLEDYWVEVGNTKADYKTGGQTDGGAVIMQGETGLLGLDWHDNDAIDLDFRQIRSDTDGLLTYELQVKTKVTPTGNNGRFYLLGLSFRLLSDENGIDSGYGLSFFRYTQGVNVNQIPDWVYTLSGFGGIQDGIPYLVLWKKVDGGNIILIDHAVLGDAGHSESFLSGGELDDWVTMMVRVEERYAGPENETENHITAYIQHPTNIHKGTKEWDYSKYINVNWTQNGVGTIVDLSLDSSGVEDGANEIGVHSFYDGGGSQQQFFADFGLLL